MYLPSLEGTILYGYLLLSLLKMFSVKNKPCTKGIILHSQESENTRAASPDEQSLKKHLLVWITLAFGLVTVILQDN